MRPRSHSNSAKLGKERAEKCEAKRKQKRREFKCCGKPLDLGSRQDFCYLHETEFDCELLLLLLLVFFSFQPSLLRNLILRFRQFQPRAIPSHGIYFKRRRKYKFNPFFFSFLFSFFFFCSGICSHRRLTRRAASCLKLCSPDSKICPFVRLKNTLCSSRAIVHQLCTFIQQPV